MTDQSVRKAFESALLKIKSVLNTPDKDHLEYLHSHVEVYLQRRDQVPPDFPDKFLTEIQKAAVQKQVLEIEYYSTYKDQLTTRTVEPIGLFYYSAAWHLIAWCQLRNDYRDFRADRIKEMKNLEKPFTNHNLISLQEYLRTVMQTHQEVERVVVVFDKAAVRYLGSYKHLYGFVEEEDLGEKVRMIFLTGYIHGIARWLISYGNKVSVEQPEKLNDILANITEELSAHYLKVTQVN